MGDFIISILSEISSEHLRFFIYCFSTKCLCFFEREAGFSFIYSFHSFESYIIGRFYRITQILQLPANHIPTRIKPCDTLPATTRLTWIYFLKFICCHPRKSISIRHGTIPSIGEDICWSYPEDLREDIAEESPICRMCYRRYAHESDDYSCDNSGNEGFLHKKEIHDKILLNEIICNSLEISSTFSRYGRSRSLSFLGWCDFLVLIFSFRSHIFSSIVRRGYSRSSIHTTSSRRKISRS